ncbi:MAG: iron-sulfur cluster assembly accessory protein [Gammaproteobacteria bacterium]|jgi:iron-sulfur cluster assembly protein
MKIELTENAAARVNTMLQQRGNGLGLRLGTRASGCSGFEYVVDYADEIDDRDEVFECHGVKVVVDRGSLPYLNGTVVDYVKMNALNEGFEFNNPNVKNRCGCGESFTV